VLRGRKAQHSAPVFGEFHGVRNGSDYVRDLP
jgi:hypothetical protein